MDASRLKSEMAPRRGYLTPLDEGYTGRAPKGNCLRRPLRLLGALAALGLLCIVPSSVALLGANSNLGAPANAKAATAAVPIQVAAALSDAGTAASSATAAAASVAGAATASIPTAVPSVGDLPLPPLPMPDLAVAPSPLSPPLAGLDRSISLTGDPMRSRVTRDTQLTSWTTSARTSTTHPDPDTTTPTPGPEATIVTDPALGGGGASKSVSGERDVRGGDAAQERENAGTREGARDATPPEPLSQLTSRLRAVDLPEDTLVLAGTAAAGGVGLALWAMGPVLLRWLAGLGLYSRVDRGAALNHASRGRVMALLEAQPGLHFHEICRRLGMQRTTTQHHLRKLVEVGLLVEEAGSGYTCFFPKGAVDRRVMAAAPLLKAEAARRLLNRVIERPGATLRQVAADCGIGTSGAHYHLDRLAQAGLLERAVHADEMTWVPTEAGRLAAAPVAAA